MEKYGNGNNGNLTPILYAIRDTKSIKIFVNNYNNCESGNAQPWGIVSLYVKRQFIAGSDDRKRKTYIRQRLFVIRDHRSFRLGQVMLF